MQDRVLIINPVDPPQETDDILSCSEYEHEAKDVGGKVALEWEKMPIKPF